MTNVCIIVGDSRDRLTEQCIRSFYENTPAGSYSLTVLANNVGESTAKLLERRCGEAVSWHHESLGGGAVTNRLIEAARCDQGEFLYHTASDFYFREGWLEGLLANMPVAEAMGIGLLGAYSHPFHRTTSVVPGVAGYAIHSKDMVSGGSWFMRWSTWDCFGPLTEEHTGLYVGGEDTAFNFKLIEAGVGRATLVPEMVVHTGRTNSAGQPTIGADFMPDVPGVLIE